MPKVIHYRKNCIGCNSCVEHAASRWKIDKDGKSTLIGADEKKDGVFILEIEEGERDANEKAARDCPSRIIQVSK